jgi:hypothetical protein
MSFLPIELLNASAALPVSFFRPPDVAFDIDQNGRCLTS